VVRLEIRPTTSVELCRLSLGQALDRYDLDYLVVHGHDIVSAGADHVVVIPVDQGNHLRVRKSDHSPAQPEQECTRRIRGPDEQRALVERFPLAKILDGDRRPGTAGALFARLMSRSRGIPGTENDESQQRNSESGTKLPEHGEIQFDSAQWGGQAPAGPAQSSGVLPASVDPMTVREVAVAPTSIPPPEAPAAF
jgi:hypothetical protein